MSYIFFKLKELNYLEIKEMMSYQVINWFEYVNYDLFLINN
jgi:hypothetical protein